MHRLSSVCHVLMRPDFPLFFPKYPEITLIDAETSVLNVEVELSMKLFL